MTKEELKTLIAQDKETIHSLVTEYDRKKVELDALLERISDLVNICIDRSNMLVEMESGQC